MPFSIVFCTGMLRSGSTWSFNVCRLMAKAVAGREGKPMWSGFLSAEEADRFLETFGPNPPGPTVIKCHVLGPRGLKMLSDGVAKAICTYRDPRDCVASMMTFTDRTFDEATFGISTGLELLEHYSRSNNTLLVRYEEMMRAPPARISAIAAHLGLVFEPELLARIDEQTGIEQSKRVCEDLRHRQRDQFLLSTENHRVDPQTWLHHNHIYSGETGRWKQELTPVQVQALNQAFAPWLVRLGYPT